MSAPELVLADVAARAAALPWPFLGAPPALPRALERERAERLRGRVLLALEQLRDRRIPAPARAWKRLEVRAALAELHRRGEQLRDAAAVDRDRPLGYATWSELLLAAGVYLGGSAA